MNNRSSLAPHEISVAQAKFNLGQVVKHRAHNFRGVVFDIDPQFAQSEEWYQAIPETHRPRKEQPYYHLFAENEASYYIAYVSEQNLELDATGEPVEHPEIAEYFTETETGDYKLAGELN